MANREGNEFDPRRDALSHPGFTLIELVLSLLLMSVLLGVTWSLMGIFHGRFERSQQQTEEAQLIRSLQQTLERDLLSCVAEREYREDALANGSSTRAATRPEPNGIGATSAPDSNADERVSRQDESSNEAERFAGESAMSDSQTLARFDQRDPTSDTISRGSLSLVESHWQAPETLLIGDSVGLVLDAVPPAEPDGMRPRSSMASEDRANIPDVQRRIVYLFSAPREALVKGRPPGLVRCELTLQELMTFRQTGAAQSDLLSLIRPQFSTANESLNQGNAATTANAIAESNVQVGESFREDTMTEGTTEQRLEIQQSPRTIRAQQVDYVPEIAELRFRYYDGVTWQPSWDSRKQKRLPQAVEMRFQLESELAPTLSEQDSTAENFDVTDDVEASRAIAVAPELQEPVDDRMRSSLSPPPQDHRYLIHLHAARPLAAGQGGTQPDEMATGVANDSSIMPTASFSAEGQPFPPRVRPPGASTTISGP